MKSMLFRIISLMLVLSMTLGGIIIPAWAAETEVTEPAATQETVPAATEPEETVPETTVPEETEPVELPPMTTDDGHYIAYPGLLNQFDFPENWSKAALQFCVGNRIIEGRDDGLAPKANTTRAETAAILVRMLGAKANPAVLAGYTDARPGAWYYDEVSAAVSVGLMKGTSDTTVNPNANLTREDACVLLSRAFGILPLDGKKYEAFQDAASVSGYARNAVSGMLERKILTGYTDNTFRPKASITRAEFAQLVYRTVTHICDNPSQLPAYGRVLYRGAEELPAGYRLNGTMILGYGYCAGGNLEDVDVTSCLVLNAVPGKKITMTGCDVQQLVVSSKQNVICDTTAQYLMIGEEGSVVDAAAKQIRLFAGCTLDGSYGNIHVLKDGSCLNLKGEAKNIYIYPNYVTVQGSGYADAVDIYGTNCKVTLKCGKCTDHIYQAAYYNALGTVQTVDSWYNYQRQEPYSTATMEGFVNLKGYSSDTEYLIWVSTTTTTVNIFQGSKGAWKLVRSAACALGAPYSPTVKGTFKTYIRDNEWDFGSYKCRWVTNFYHGYAFHSRKWSRDYSYLVDPSINCLVSAGCVRMYDEDCYFIYSEVPIGTTVVVY